MTTRCCRDPPARKKRSACFSWLEDLFLACYSACSSPVTLPAGCLQGRLPSVGSTGRWSARERAEAARAAESPPCDYRLGRTRTEGGEAGTACLAPNC